MNFRNIVLALATLVLLWFAVPNFLAAIWMATGDPIYRDIGTQKQLTNPEIEALIESREQAITLVNSPKAATDLATAYMALDPSHENLEKALVSLRSGINLAPMNAFAWQRLAGLLVFKPDRGAEAVSAWKTARQLAEYDTFLFHDRIRIGTQLYRAMTLPDRQMLVEDVERAYAENRGRLRSYAKQANLLEWMKFLLRDEEKTTYLSS